MNCKFCNGTMDDLGGGSHGCDYCGATYLEEPEVEGDNWTLPVWSRTEIAELVGDDIASDIASVIASEWQNQAQAQADKGAICQVCFDKMIATPSSN